MIDTYVVEGLEIQAGDVLCMAFNPESCVNTGDYWRILGLLIPGEVDHVAVYVGPGGRCVEACARGVYTFDLEDNQWAPEKMFKHRGRLKDHLVGVAYPLQAPGGATEPEARVRQAVAAYCLAQVGKPYNINLLNPEREDAFYCSQLAFKAYQPFGINLNTGLGVPDLPGSASIIFPQEIWSGCAHLRAGQ